METLVKLLTVFVTGAVELWAAVPLGFVLQLHPIVVGVTAAAGAVSGVAVVLSLGQAARDWIQRRRGGSGDDRDGRLGRVWRRYGVPGLGVVAPFLVGAPLGTAVGIALGAPPGRLLLWLSLGIAICSAALTSAIALGLSGVEALHLGLF